jgi:hypothetical protein
MIAPSSGQVHLANRSFLKRRLREHPEAANETVRVAPCGILQPQEIPEDETGGMSCGDRSRCSRRPLESYRAIHWSGAHLSRLGRIPYRTIPLDATRRAAGSTWTSRTERLRFAVRRPANRRASTSVALRSFLVSWWSASSTPIRTPRQRDGLLGRAAETCRSMPCTAFRTSSELTTEFICPAPTAAEEAWPMDQAFRHDLPLLFSLTLATMESRRAR